MTDVTQNNHAKNAAVKVTLVGSFVDLFLGVTKVITGWFANSHALIADGIHSLSDLATDVIVLVLLRLSYKPPDKSHPWGHLRFQTIGTAALGTVLIAVGVLLSYEMIQALLAGQSNQNISWSALLVAGISILSKEFIYHYSVKVGEQIQSDLLIANAWHSRLDALTSIIVFIALVGSMYGVWWLDAIAAIIVAGFVCKIGWQLVSKSIMSLVDTALPEEQVARFKEVVMSVDGVQDAHGFKTRNMANLVVLEMHLQVAPYSSASESHFIGNNAVANLKRQFPEISQVIFHIDTYDDQAIENTNPISLPTRADIEAIVQKHLNSSADELLISLYYKPTGLEICINLSPALLAKIKQGQGGLEQVITDIENELQQNYKNAIGRISFVADI